MESLSRLDLKWPLPNTLSMQLCELDLPIYRRKEQQLYDGAKRKAMALKWWRPLIVLMPQQWFFGYTDVSSFGLPASAAGRRAEYPPRGFGQPDSQVVR